MGGSWIPPALPQRQHVWQLIKDIEIIIISEINGAIAINSKHDYVAQENYDQSFSILKIAA